MKPARAPELVLGLDPGSRHTGYAVLAVDGDRLRAAAWGRISCSPKQPLPNRLHKISSALTELVAEHRPEAVAIETLYHGINSRSLIVLAQARGALLSAIAASDLEVFEYSPSQIKSAVTGHGRADKSQVLRMVSMLLSVPAKELTEDAADALAIAICYAHRKHLDRLEARLGAAP